MKKLFGLLGFPVSHSLSPFIYNTIFNLLNFNASYSLLEVNPKDFNSFFEMFPNLSGFNVTMPFKNLMFKKIKEHDQVCLKFKTTNLVVKKNYGFKCYNTDNYGFLKSLQQNNVFLKGEILLLGLGGAGKIVAINSILKGCFLTVAVREKFLKEAKNTLKELLPLKFYKKFKIVDISKIPLKSYNVVVNATPVGMHPFLNQMPIKKEILYYSKAAVDLIYNPLKTPFLKTAKKFKIKNFNGLNMLLFQAQKTASLFTNSHIKKEIVFKLKKDIVKILKQKS